MNDEDVSNADIGPARNVTVREETGRKTGRAPAQRESEEFHDGDRPPRRRPPWHRRPALVGGLMLVAVACIVGGALFWRHSRTYETTDDAFVDVISQRVSPQIAGRVLRVFVDDNQDVSAGQVLLEIDPADFQNRLEQAQANQTQVEAQLAQTQAQRVVLQAQVEQARATEGVAAATEKNAASDLKRFQQLRADNVGAVTEQQVDRAVADAASTAAQLHAAQRAVAVAEAQLDFAAKQIEAARALTKSAAAQVAQAELTLSYTKVKAMVDGRIARKTIGPGDYVQPGLELMAVVPRAVYVTANFKETQLARMRRGQPVDVRVDSYPDFKLHGRVNGVQPATGQAFDVLPSQNVAGNWVKVVQRVPVKITLDQIPDDPERRLAPGMSVEVKVKVK